MEYLKLEFNGETLSVPAWAKRLGVSEQCIYGRLDRGWDLARTLTTPVEKLPTKNEAELELNDLPKNKLPTVLLKIMDKAPCKGKRYGYWFRTFYRAEFDKWFQETYCLKEERKVACFENHQKQILVK